MSQVKAENLTKFSAGGTLLFLIVGVIASIESKIEILFVIAIGSIYFNENFETLVYIGMFLVTFGVVFNVTYFKSDKQNI